MSAQKMTNLVDKVAMTLVNAALLAALPMAAVLFVSHSLCSPPFYEGPDQGILAGRSAARLSHPMPGASVRRGEHRVTQRPAGSGYSDRRQ